MILAVTLAQSGRLFLKGLERLFAAQRHRAVVWLAVCYGAGAVSYFTAQDQPARWAGVALLGAVFLCAVPAKRRLRAVLGGLAVFLAGASVAELRIVSLDHVVLEREIGPVGLRGQVIRQSLRDGTGQRLEIRRVSYDAMAQAASPRPPLPGRIRLTWRGAPVPQSVSSARPR